MANVPNPAVASVELRGSLLGQTYINRFHVSGPVVGGVPTPVVEGGLESTLQKVRTWLLTEYLPNMPVALRINTVVGRQLIPEGGVQVELPVDQDGGEEGDVLPNNVALCMTLTSGLTGRSGRGRVYLGGILRAWQIENSISPVIGEALRLRWESLRSNLATFAPQFSHGMVVYSTEVNGAPRAVGLATPVSSIILRDTTFDSQRRRLPGRGR